MDVEGLRTFCLDLSTDRPSPGGGAASAAAGAMAASLLIMVCGVTGRSKKHVQDKPKLDDLKADLVKMRDELLSLASLDAEAYDAVANASRRLRGEETDGNRQAYQDALHGAVDVPARTADRCLMVIEKSRDVAKVQTSSASSDTAVAVSLARAAFEGAAANVEINLLDMTDQGFVRRITAEMLEKRGRVEDLARESISILMQSR